jgi:hypothetical protein
VLAALLDSAWIARRPVGRAVAVTPRGAAGLRAVLDLDVAGIAPDGLERPLRHAA